MESSTYLPSTAVTPDSSPQLLVFLLLRLATNEAGVRHTPSSLSTFLLFFFSLERQIPSVHLLNRVTVRVGQGRLGSSELSGGVEVQGISIYIGHELLAWS